ncbi:MAG: sigma-70 family RNA polymerase sigma factor [Bacillota bacterium]|nr:sigma-70 family RNA polymerase sigma factor [Bacillota bacterium]
MIDVNLIMAAQNQDEDAFRTIFNQYYKKIYKTSYFILMDSSQAEDVVQETLLQVYLKINKLSDVLSFERWVYRITVNTCYEFMRKKNNKNEYSLEDFLEIFPNSLVSAEISPENSMMQNELQRKVLEAIYKLPLKHRIVVILYYYNDMNINEIANVTKSLQGTVKSRLFYARKILKKSLTEEQANFIEKNNGGVLYEHR